MNSFIKKVKGWLAKKRKSKRSLRPVLDNYSAEMKVIGAHMASRDYKADPKLFINHKETNKYPLGSPEYVGYEVRRCEIMGGLDSEHK
jgi:hypothetical protein